MQNQTDRSQETPAAVATVEAVKQRLISLFIRGAFAMHSHDPAALPTRDEVRAVAMAVLDAALAEVPDADACHVESTRRAVLDLLDGCPTPRVAKRDALFTIGVLLDAGLFDTFTELVQSDVMNDIANAVIAKVAADPIATDKVGGK